MHKRPTPLPPAEFPSHRQPTHTHTERESEISMRNLLKKLQMVPDDSGVRTPLLTLPGWFGSAACRGGDLPAPSSSSSSASSSSTFTAPSSSSGMSALDEEEHQIHLALELSVREEPEAVQIEAVKQISLGEVPAGFTPAEVVAFRYWNHNTIGYDDKILDGFYDLYGILPESASMKMPSLVDLQRIPVSGSVCWEAVLVNRPADPDLLMLERKALKMAHELQLGAVDYTYSFVEGLCILVANAMGGSVHDSAQMLDAWRSQSSYLKTSIQSNVLPLGLLTVGLARHRALLFKVQADAVGIPCRLVKGELGAGLEDGVRTIVKLNDGREYIVDLMEEPGVLIPSDASGAHNINNGKLPSLATTGGDTHITLSDSDCSSLSYTTSCNDIKKKASVVDAYATSESDGCIPGALMGAKMKKAPHVGIFSNENKDDNSCVSADQKNPWNDDKALQNCLSLRPTQPCALVKSPSWTEGVNSSKFRKKKVKDVSRYMIDATKENPKLAQRIHDVLLESGVAVPPHLFTEISRQQRENAKGKIADGSLKVYKNVEIGSDEKSSHNDLTEIVSTCLPNTILKPIIPSSTSETECSKPIFEGRKLSLNAGEYSVISAKSQMEESSVQPQDSPIKFIDNLPVSAAVAAAAIVASSMVVAVAKSTTGSKIETTAAATATAAAAAAVIASTAVSKQHEQLQLQAFAPPHLITHNEASAQEEHERNIKNARNGGGTLQEYPPKGDAEVNKVIQEMERTSDKSSGSGSERSDVSHDDVGELEIPWEEITLGDRIGIGSYGEVYRGEWHGTEVAVKRFLDQDMSGDALEEFKSEVQIMRKLRHPNVVLLMGAVTHVPNLSIVTEFLPRGSLYRLIHRPNNQIDERRRLKMALDVARGMNYLHNCSPVVVHRDLKSPNLLVDKNWVVKVCDFGLSRAKQNTFLSSRSTAGTAEWMSPEMLRNEPSNEKCDVFSFGVILWELYTLQQPWKGMNPMQVVGAVGFQHRRLDIPEDINPAITDIILRCWQTDPQKRPSFSEIMESLKSLQKQASSSPSVKPKKPPSS